MTKNIAIIGAGLSGLTAAHALKGSASVKLFDKSRGVGGRMSTRYAGDYEFDHGAQYFTARDPAFQNAVEAAIEQGVVAPWDGRAFYLKEDGMTADTGGDRFVGAPRMNSWAKFLAQGLDISLGSRVSELERDGQEWKLHFEDGSVQRGFDHVICAIPSVQAIALLPESFSGMTALKAVQMDACFALMIGLDQAYDFDWDSLRTQQGPASWLAVNSDKPGRAEDQTTLMVHAGPEWSNEYAESDRAWVEREMIRAASDICGQDLSKADYLTLHRWLYASVSASPKMGAIYDAASGLTACGDWCLGGRVEGAYLSGLAAAQTVFKN